MNGMFTYILRFGPVRHLLASIHGHPLLITLHQSDSQPLCLGLPKESSTVSTMFKYLHSHY